MANNAYPSSQDIEAGYYYQEAAGAQDQSSEHTYRGYGGSAVPSQQYELPPGSPTIRPQDLLYPNGFDPALLEYYDNAFNQDFGRGQGFQEAHAADQQGPTHTYLDPQYAAALSHQNVYPQPQPYLRPSSNQGLNPEAASYHPQASGENFGHQQGFADTGLNPGFREDENFFITQQNQHMPHGGNPGEQGSAIHTSTCPALNDTVSDDWDSEDEDEDEDEELLSTPDDTPSPVDIPHGLLPPPTPGRSVDMQAGSALQNSLLNQPIHNHIHHSLLNGGPFEQYLGNMGGHVPANGGDYGFSGTSGFYGGPAYGEAGPSRQPGYIAPLWHDYSEPNIPIKLENAPIPESSVPHHAPANQHGAPNPKSKVQETVDHYSQLTAHLRYFTKTTERSMKHTHFWKLIDPTTGRIAGLPPTLTPSSTNADDNNNEVLDNGSSSGKRAVRTFTNNWAAADEYRNRVQTAPMVDPTQDATLHEVFGFVNGVSQAERWVKILYTAMINTEAIRDAARSPVTAFFKSHGYDPQLLEATCIAILDALRDRCLNGFRGPASGDKATKCHSDCVRDRMGTCVERLRNVVEALRINKRICIEVMYEDSKIRGLVNAPLMCVRVKKARKRWNDTRRAKARAKRDREVVVEQEGEEDEEEYEYLDDEDGDV